MPAGPLYRGFIVQKALVLFILGMRTRIFCLAHASQCVNSPTEAAPLLTAREADPIVPQAIVCQIAVVYEYFYRLQEEGGAGVTDYVNYYYILSSTVDWKKIVF